MRSVTDLSSAITVCELLASARDEAGVDLIAATLAAPALAVPVAETEGVTIECFERQDLQLAWAGCLVARDHDLVGSQTLKLLERALAAEHLWNNEQPADHWRAPVHSDRSLARLGGQTFFRPHVAASASRLVKVANHARVFVAALQKLDRYAESLEAWLAANMPEVLYPQQTPGQELDQMISEFIGRKAAAAAQRQTLPSGLTIRLAPPRKKTA
jgi:hypothetical protein